MRMKLKEVFAAFTHVSFLETIDSSKEMELHVEVEDMDEKPCLDHYFIKIEYEDGEICIAQILMNPQKKTGSICVKHASGCGCHISECDEYGNPVEGYKRKWIVNQKEIIEDSVDIKNEESEKEVYVRLEHYNAEKTTLHIRKYRLSFENEEYEDDCNDEYNVCIQDDTDQKWDITLKKENAFEECIQIPRGKYYVETQQQGYDSWFLVNGQEKDCLVLDDEDTRLDMFYRERKDAELQLSLTRKTPQGKCLEMDREEVWYVRIVSLYYDEIIELNCENGFSQTLSHLCPDCYDIYLVDRDGLDTYYCVNGVIQEDRACICLEKAEHACIEIVQECELPTVQCGILRIEKAIQKDGELWKPCDDESFTIEVEGNDFCEQFVLDGENVFCIVLHDLNEGCYRVKELSNEDICYLVDGEETSCAQVQVENEHCYLVQIITAYKEKGKLRIEAYEENEHVCKPCREEIFHVILSSCFHSYDIELNEGNNWCVCFDDLPYGTYELVEQGDSDSCICYLVNGRREKNARIYIDDRMQEVCIMSTCKRQAGNLKIYAYEECKKKENSFEVSLCKEDFEETYTLCEENNWCIEVSGLYWGEYRLQSAQAIFLCNDKEYYEDLCIYMDERDREIGIRSDMREQGGKLILTQYVRNQDGNAHMPFCENVYPVELFGNGVHEKVYLCKQNDFCVCFTDLLQGCYQIRSYGKNGCDEEGEEKIINLGCEDVNVDIMQEEENGVVLLKICPNGNWNLCGCFEVELTSCDKHQHIVLDASNSYCVCLHDLCMQEYEICVDDGIEGFVVDGLKQDHGCFFFDGEDKEICLLARNENMIEISAYEEEDNCVYEPNQNSCYEVVIEGEGVCESVVLDKYNHFCVQLYSMCDGYYEIYQKQEDTLLCYEVNGEVCERACVTLCQNCADVVLRNARGMGAKLCLHGLIEENSIQKSIEKEIRLVLCRAGKRWSISLNKENQGCVCLEDLECGSYTLTGIDEEELRFETADGIFHDAVCIEIGREEVDIQIIVTKKTEFPLTVQYHSKNKESCQVRMQHRGKTHTFMLEEDNEWMKMLGLLKEGDISLEVMKGIPVSYIVNGSKMQQARFLLDKETFVEIVPEDKEEGVKGEVYLQCVEAMDSCESYRQPSVDDCYQVGIDGENYHEIFELNKENGWKVKVTNLKDGNYEVKEIGGTMCTYMVDGKEETRNVTIHVQNDTHHIKIVTGRNLEEHKSSLEICMMEQQDGNMVYPKQVYHAVLHHGIQHKMIELNPENHFYVSLQHLEDGMYDLELQENGKAFYILDGTNKKQDSHIEMKSDHHTLQIVLQKENKGSIRIEKYVRKGNQKQLQPSNQDCKIRISKPGYNEIFTLCKDNSYTCMVYGLEDGEYVISSVDALEPLSYIVNKGSEKTNGTLEVHGNHNLVEVIENRDASYGFLRVTKFMRNMQGQLVPPSDAEIFRILVTGNNFSMQYELNEDNDWQQDITGLAPGRYEVKEISAHNYQVSYVVDTSAESTQAIIDVQENVHTVQIINSIQAPATVLEITKFIRQGNGNLMRPVSGDVFLVNITGESVKRQVELNNGNSFTARLRDLPSGVYQIEEVGKEDFVVTYRVNGGAESSQASVDLKERNQVVEIINERAGNLNTMEIFKYMLEKNGNFIAPNQNEVFYFELRGEGVFERYELNANNNWHITLTQYPSGTYQVKEIGSSYRVQYFVNSDVLQDQAVFEAQPGKTNIIGIINYRNNVQNGSMRISKKVEGQNQPDKMNSYIIEVRNESAGYSHDVTLDDENNFTSELNNLPYGRYVLYENSEDFMYWIMDGKILNGRAVIDVQDEKMHEIIAVNKADISEKKHEDIHIVF